MAAAALSLIAAFSASAQTVRYIHTDGLGSVVLVTDKDRNPVTRSEYEPYGSLLNRPIMDGPGYTGHVIDAATGLNYMQQRYYDPGLGEFISTDPVSAYENPFKGFNRYLYANGNPYTFKDPDGRQSWSDFRKGFGDGARNANYGEYGFPYKSNWAEQAGYAIGAGIVKGGQSHGGVRIPSMKMRVAVPQKRGPKTDPSAPHNATIREEANRLKSEGHLIIAGGGEKPEVLIPTPGGVKNGRRPDILHQTPEGEIRGTNVGLTYANGAPIKREVEAMNDLNGAGVKMDFKPYEK
ncbi:RHS repeat-associated core domain-containing protein [uncultured Xanthomonas sp.]|nr:RHS repeat-associated core domain-containing protein [uncultured Xanthomonas sp.]